MAKKIYTQTSRKEYPCVVCDQMIPAGVKYTWTYAKNAAGYVAWHEGCQAPAEYLNSGHTSDAKAVSGAEALKAETEVLAEKVGEQAETIIELQNKIAELLHQLEAETDSNFAIG